MKKAVDTLKNGTASPDSLLRIGGFLFLTVDRHSPGDIIAHTSNDLLAVQIVGGMGMVAAVDAMVISGPRWS